jgi:phage tail protein X
VVLTAAERYAELEQLLQLALDVSLPEVTRIDAAVRAIRLLDGLIGDLAGG